MEAIWKKRNKFIHEKVTITIHKELIIHELKKTQMANKYLKEKQPTIASSNSTKIYNWNTFRETNWLKLLYKIKTLHIDKLNLKGYFYKCNLSLNFILIIYGYATFYYYKQSPFRRSDEGRIKYGNSRDNISNMFLSNDNEPKVSYYSRSIKENITSITITITITVTVTITITTTKCLNNKYKKNKNA
ncbi:hypothetical protein ACTFIV_000197 [Dictyostelium citrinum]